MKFLINFLMMSTLSTPLYAQSKIILISHQQKLAHAHHIKSVLTTEYAIPEDFIQLEESEVACEKRMKNVKWHLCINETGDLDEVSSDQQFMHETLKVFLKG